MAFFSVFPHCMGKMVMGEMISGILLYSSMHYHIAQGSRQWYS